MIKGQRVVAAVAVAACAVSAALALPPTSLPADLSALRIENAWIRWLPAGLPGGAYATLINGGARAVRLVGAFSADYGEISLHSTRMQDGMAQMRPVSQIVIDAHSSLNFEVAGYHMMLLQPRRPVSPGDRVPITLRFSEGNTITVEFQVRRPDGGR